MDSRKLRIVQKVRSLYYRYGIRSVTMDEVARILGISKKTLYEHFRNKQELVREVLAEDYRQSLDFTEEIRNRNLNAIEEMFEMYRMIHGIFKEYNPAVVYDVRKYYPLIYTEMKTSRRKLMYDATLENMIQGKREGFYRSDLDEAVIAKFHLARYESLFESDLFTPEDISSFSMYHEAFVYHIYGIVSEKGRVFFEMNFKKFRSSF